MSNGKFRNARVSGSEHLFDEEEANGGTTIFQVREEQERFVIHDPETKRTASVFKNSDIQIEFLND